MSGRSRICLTIDVEHDCPPFLQTYDGIEQGMPSLLELLANEGIATTLFTTGDVARKYPHAVESWVGAGHELGCHGDTHRRFDRMSLEESRQELNSATTTLRSLTPEVRAFRAPNLMFPPACLPLLSEFGYQLDSSQGKHKLAYYTQSSPATSLQRVPASAPSSVLRLPAALRNPIYSGFRDPVVLIVHPWEFVDWRASMLRWDCRFRTGDKALDCLRTTIAYFRKRGGEFLRMCDLDASRS